MWLYNTYSTGFIFKSCWHFGAGHFYKCRGCVFSYLNIQCTHFVSVVDYVLVIFWTYMWIYPYISDILCRRYVHTIWFDAWQPPGGTLEKNKVLKRSTMAPTRSHWLSLQWWRWFFVSLCIATNAPIKAFRAASVWCAGALLTTGTSYYQIHPRFVRSQTALHQGDCHRIKLTLFITRPLFSLWSTPAAQARARFIKIL